MTLALEIAVGIILVPVIIFIAQFLWMVIWVGCWCVITLVKNFVAGILDHELPR